MFLCSNRLDLLTWPINLPLFSAAATMSRTGGDLADLIRISGAIQSPTRTAAGVWGGNGLIGVKIEGINPSSQNHDQAAGSVMKSKSFSYRNSVRG